MCAITRVLDNLLINIADTRSGDREHRDANLTIVDLLLQPMAKSLLVIDTGLITNFHDRTMPGCDWIQERRR